MGVGTNPRTFKINEESYFHLELMMVIFKGACFCSRRCFVAQLTIDNLPNDPRERSPEECSLTFAEEVINTSLFC